MNIHKAVLFIALSAGLLYGENRIEAVQQAIRDAGAAWYTGRSWVASLSAHEFAELCGTLSEPPADAASRLIRLKPISSLPSRFDWRNNNGNWVTPVRNQGGCGSCWNFSALAQVEAWYQIFNGTPDSGIDLSEQFVLSCAGVGTCRGGSIEGALSFVRDFGVPFESCMPYRARDDIPCSNACPESDRRMITIPDWGYVTLNEILIDNLKQAVFRHPVSVSYTVFEDFQFYGGGVYRHVWGKAVGGHGVLIVGWDDEGKCWICKNSWGADWGENGYFRILWGDSGLGSFAPFVYDAVTESAVAFVPDSLSFELTAGEEIQAEFHLENRGSVPLDYALFCEETPQVFHVSAFNAYDDFSWWCGSPALGGYANHWLQYLDTPPLDLTTTTNPMLKFVAFWSIEPPEGTDPPWDGWDGANVWISTDGGQSFQIIRPLFPPYSCSSLWAFGEKEQGWNMGPNIPGWAGKSNGWQPAAFDLSPYRSSQTVIRFAFASDMGFSTLDDPTVTGFFIDCISVSDGGKILFSDEGENAENLHRSGYGSMPAAWLKTSPSLSTIPPQSKEPVRLVVSAQDIDPGDYLAKVLIESNDRTADSLALPVALHVNKPPFDLAVYARVQRVEKLFVGDLLPLSALVKNLGTQLFPNISVTCTISDGLLTHAAVSRTITDLESGRHVRIDFSRFVVPDTTELKAKFQLQSAVGDNRPSNDSASTMIFPTALVDDFESGEGEWLFTGGWGVTNRYGGHSGKYAAHCNGGLLPYRANMNAVMTLRRSFAAERLESAWISFWANCHMQLDKDYCVLEISADSLTWQPVYQFSNQNLNYEQHRVELTPFLPLFRSRLWIRFRFVSNEQEESAGVFIDDVCFYGKVKQFVTAADDRPAQPVRHLLLGNYPNPFNAFTRIHFFLPDDALVELSVYSIDGKRVAALLRQYHGAGEHSLSWRPDLPSGIYFLRMDVSTVNGDRNSAYKKLAIIK
ncbi:MAG: T9SS type A sorting domain-containing protein [candidate division KSB1 bacterium]|nr:T9SS type A sorting domain-containing protein [candidate division KSB1 bacterium]MDZ7345221.1 T9SS type A sorting domain-containing protein [candidate division KSB1 bacterium]